MNKSIQIGFLLVVPILALIIYYLLGRYILFKYTLKKRYLIAALFVVILFPVVLVLINPAFLLPQWAYLLQMVLFTVIFLVYVDTLKRDKIAKKKQKMAPVGKPKPNPNRVKNKM